MWRLSFLFSVRLSVTQCQRLNFFFPTKFDVRDIDGKLSYKSKFGASGLFGGVALFKGFKKILS